MSPIDGSNWGSIDFPVALSQATSRPDGQSPTCLTKFFLALGLSVSFTRFHTCPCGSQKRAKAQSCSTSVNDQGGTLHDLGLTLIGFAAGCFRAVESYFGMRVVAERLLPALSATAQRVRCLRRIYMPGNPFDRLAGRIRTDGLLG